MLIGELSKALGIPSSTIRYYEKINLIPKMRANNGYRNYPDEIVHLLKLIIQAKELGFTLSEIKELSSLIQDLGQERGKIRLKLEDKLHDLENRIKELRTFKKNISALLNAKCPL
ncbi:MerR family transcriptional regulator [Halobacteriovorax sp. GB3]|uniref:MerR family transcriptional regulator n=1 Tax=Halobacteriovorax sp. GB3 TaxID=2719615 RepID=UPI002361BCCB|nr:MerR family transcriptional regulator [Halobacteriovorax sp. GB3]MDD0852036.1 MerR family transcriptional regulator [Halobacteriovorax sp. GB3]